MMKTHQGMRTAIGLKQKGLATLLGISRQRLSMFEAGKRDLPVHLLRMIASLADYMQQGKRTNEDSGRLRLEQKKEQHFLESRFRENEFQRLRTAKLIKRLAERQKQDNLLQELGQFLMASDTAQKDNAVIASIRDKAEKSSGSMHFDELLELRYKMELLETERKLLQAKLKQEKSS
ncbi:helix-turn-helix domain-containing protein [Flavobacterium silvaticum]|uniref:Helix-turn-helix domain-containing protein n=1 Tax=Flavobacterium silvaticum TaxID=1852020 RepID=A0A972FMD5_9FLAO|nr:helix-turn-helix transcriptional regulator [Flavobacterium silvaticum]NMH28719.1 helix-turn-helix domain-containing protein [Flavobacterium silvaticum]